MNLIKSTYADINYLAKLVKIENFSNHPNPEVTKMKCCTVDGYNIITSIDAKPDWYIYFPTSCTINGEFLSYANLYRNKVLNANSEIGGFFESNGRVCAIRLKGALSEGFILPFTVLQNFIVDNFNCEVPDPKEVLEFDTIEHNGKTFWLNKKYIPNGKGTSNSMPKGNHKNQPKLDRIIPNQFRFHYDTVIMKKCPYVIQPNDFIHISSKWHGTSGISAYVNCHQPLNWRMKLAKLLTGNPFDKYDYLYSSRTTLKNKYYNPNVTKGFYNEDVWAHADEYLRPILEKGMTLYYEIVGYLPSGSYIQKGYDYKCVQPINGNYEINFNFKIYVYRITYTNIDGIVYEMTPLQVQQWCKDHNLLPVNQLYFGRARDLYPDLVIDDNWSNNFLEKLSNDKNFFMEEMSPDCNNKVPHEGLVIKVENHWSQAFKVKCFKFLDKEGKELDKGEVNIEDNA